MSSPKDHDLEREDGGCFLDLHSSPHLPHELHHNPLFLLLKFLLIFPSFPLSCSKLEREIRERIDGNGIESERVRVS